MASRRMELPRLIPLFPLPNVVLFPGVPLPLHIFEPRYAQMVREAQAGEPIIGMTLLKDGWQRDYYGSPPVFGTGCAGRLVSVESLPEGRFNILLHGIREFTVLEEAETEPYRKAVVAWRRVVIGAVIGVERRRQIIALLEQFLALGGDSPARRLLHDASLSDELLVNFFCYALELSALEKQGLLEASSLIERAESLRDVVEFRLAERRTTPRAPAGGDRYH